MIIISRLLFCSCILFIIEAVTLTEDLEIRHLGQKLNGRRRNIAKGWSILHGAEPGFDLTEEEIQKFKIWPQGIIPYYIDNYSFDKVLNIRLRTILNSINSVTNLRFLELSQPPEDIKERWVLFINRRGVLDCEDYHTNSFTNKGVQRVVVGYDCIGPGGGALAPIVLALAGVPPQHNAPDRDNHITVLMGNIIPEKRSLFQALRNDEWLFHDVQYDFLSAGHYEFHKYSINGSATILPKRAVIYSVGEGDGISYNDVWKIRMLYNYISRKGPTAKASDCNKLFKPGVNFNKLELENEIQVGSVESRQKPAKYLGLSDDEIEQIEEKNVSNELDSVENKNVNDDESKDNEKNNNSKNDSIDKQNYINGKSLKNDVTTENFSAFDKMDRKVIAEPSKTVLYGPANYKFIRAPPKRNPLKKMIQLKNDWRTSDSDEV